MTEPSKGLTWSKRWHLVDESKSDENYDIALCGAYLYNETKMRASHRGAQMPAHLQQILDGKRKAVGECKLCSKAAGRRTVVVDLPPPTKTILGLQPSWPVPLIDPRTGAAHSERIYNGEVWLYDTGRIAIVGVPFVLNTSADARALAVALLAAAEEKEKRNAHQAQS